MKTVVIHHSADYDGIFCREIARNFLPDAELIGWDFGDDPMPFPMGQAVYVMDLPVDAVFGMGKGINEGNRAMLSGFEYDDPSGERQKVHGQTLVWIDHHKSAIESHPMDIPGYRIDGVAACRLAWQWFVYQKDGGRDSFGVPYNLPKKNHFIERVVGEPLAVRLAGEYDIWDHRGDGDVEFQFGLDTECNPDWSELLKPNSPSYAEHLVLCGRSAMACYAKRDADIIRQRGFVIEFEGLKFLALNTARCNSQTFAAKDIPETGHDALMGFYFNGKVWTVSLYHAKHRTDIDLSQIAVKHGGGGHRGACGFTSKTLPFIS